MLCNDTNRPAMIDILSQSKIALNKMGTEVCTEGQLGMSVT